MLSLASIKRSPSASPSRPTPTRSPTAANHALPAMAIKHEIKHEVAYDDIPALRTMLLGSSEEPDQPKKPRRAASSPSASSRVATVMAKMLAGRAALTVADSQETKPVALSPISTGSSLLDVELRKDAADAHVAGQIAAGLYTLDVNAPPCKVDKDFWNGKSIGACPRGCANGGETWRTRSVHYKKYHYNVYYALLNKPTWSRLERWTHVNFGDAQDTRICVSCRVLHMPSRGELARHMEETHPDVFLSLARAYSDMFCGQILDEEVHAVMRKVLSDTKMDSALLEQVEAMSAANLDETTHDTPDASAVTASAPVAAVATASLTRNASSTSNVDEEYWNGYISDEVCPRGCLFFSNTASCRRQHYKEYHYHIYYAKWNASMDQLDRWMSYQFGDVGPSGRACVRCPDDLLKCADYGSRLELVRHIQTIHHDVFIELARAYMQIFAGQCVNEEVHRIMLNTVILYQ